MLIVFRICSPIWYHGPNQESDDPMEGPNKPGIMDALFGDTPGGEPATQTGADKDMSSPANRLSC